jgi:hypothetical protein
MWWLWILVIVAVIGVLFAVLSRRGPGAGDPAYKPEDPRRSEPGPWAGGGGA